jgi:hypothetical protein
MFPEFRKRGGPQGGRRPKKILSKRNKPRTGFFRSLVMGHRKRIESMQLHSNHKERAMKSQANLIKNGKWWVGWTDDVPGALTQGATLEEARENLIDAVRMIREPVDLSKLPKS